MCFLFCAFCYLADDVVVRVGLLVQVELLVVITPVIQRIVELKGRAGVHVVGHSQVGVASDATLLPPVDIPADIGVIHVVILATLLPQPDNVPDTDSRLRENLIVRELGLVVTLLLGLLHKSDDQLATLLVAGIGDVLAGSGNPDPDQLDSSRVLLRVGAVVHLDAMDRMVLLQLGLAILRRPEDLVRLHRHAVAPSVGGIVASGGGSLASEDASCSTVCEPGALGANITSGYALYTGSSGVGGPFASTHLDSTISSAGGGGGYMGGMSYNGLRDVSGGGGSSYYNSSIVSNVTSEGANVADNETHSGSTTAGYQQSHSLLSGQTPGKPTTTDNAAGSNGLVIIQY